VKREKVSLKSTDKGMIDIKKIDNGFADYYWLDEDGKVFNEETRSYLKINKNSYKLRTCDSNYKFISLKDLYFLVYNKNYCRDNIIDLDGEQWKEIPDTNSRYYVSNFSRIKSLIGYDAKLLNPFKTKDGYLRVSLYSSNGRRDLLLHRIVAMCFLPAPPRLDYQLHHIDFNRSNCQLSNLIWLDPKEHKNLHFEKEKKDYDKKLSKPKNNQSKEI